MQIKPGGVAPSGGGESNRCSCDGQSQGQFLTSARKPPFHRLYPVPILNCPHGRSDDRPGASELALSSWRSILIFSPKYTPVPRHPPPISCLRSASTDQCRRCARRRSSSGISPSGIVGIAALVAILASQLSSPAFAQWGPAIAGDLSTAIRVDEVDPSVRALLERAKASAIDKQWDDAVDTLEQVAEQQGAKLIRLDESRFIPVREYCQMRLAQLPPEARTIYRSRVDPRAKRLYDEGIAGRNREALEHVVDQFFLSGWTDKALLALGDIALEEGDFSQARWCWERISPELRTADGRPLWLDLRAAMEAPGEHGAEMPAAPAAALAAHVPDKTARPEAVAAKAAGAEAAAAGTAAAAGVGKPARVPLPRWLAYPDTQLNLADVRARLVLASILEGSLARARIELDELNRRHPGASGTIGGREGPYAELLARMLGEAAKRPAPPPSADWPTMGGSFDRTAHAAANPGLHTAWIIDLPLNPAGPFRTDISIVRETFGLPERRPAEDQFGLLCFHPLVVGNLVLLNTMDKIYAFDLASGKPAWPLPADTAQHEPGEIYSGRTGRESLITDATNQFHTFGVARFTMSVVGRRLYARLGSPITGRPLSIGLSTGYSYLVCLDLAAQGRLIWRIPQSFSEDDRWAFEGAPVCDGDNIYVAMRYNDVQPQEHVACYDAQTGVLRWRQMVCAAESSARSQAEEITNNLLTLDHDSLYLNTNLGAVASLSKADGRIRWLSLYPRAKQSRVSTDPPANFYRDLNPCIFYRGSLLAAPTDCEAIFSLDCDTGQQLWASTIPRDVVHLLGVGGGNLLASGQRLWWLNVDGGKVIYDWPDQTTVHGYGRGALVGDDVYFPTRTTIRVFRQGLGRTPAGNPSAATPAAASAAAQGATLAVASAGGPVNSEPTGPEVREPIRLDERDPPLSGGNLVVGGGYLLIATPDKLIALAPRGGAVLPHGHEVTQSVPVPPANQPADPPADPQHPVPAEQ